MSKQIISIKTRNEFREYFVGGTLRTIAEAFDACGIRCDLEYQPSVNGQRRTLVEQYYHTVDWESRKSINRVLMVFENEIKELFAPSHAVSGWATDSDNKHEATRHAQAEKLIYWLKQDGFDWVNGKIVATTGTPVLDDLADATHKLEGAHLLQQIQRLKESVDTDPSLAIGTAKELIETVCKTILEERGMPVDGTPDIPTLTKAVLKELSLVPEGVPEGKRGSDLIKAILRSLGTIGNDLGQLRGLYGTGHGKSANTQPLQPRHAKLAVGAAATLVTFLFETHRDNK
ncbi:MAG: hypothetical protein FD187_2463 [bacterium]|nr:MAG: hypothetical protein FD142_2888 [bacterium]KAF0147898.1 MAG: hypothetical protein FD187_2463 [bacterium]KAF0167499.1 MAG: hypothetical protein FD158_2281 [bacterium]TXT20965.1 MAG: hypothetical protein FD132_883 [bacterium]